MNRILQHGWYFSICLPDVPLPLTQSALQHLRKLRKGPSGRPGEPHGSFKSRSIGICVAAAWSAVHNAQKGRSKCAYQQATTPKPRSWDLVLRLAKVPTRDGRCLIPTYLGLSLQASTSPPSFVVYPSSAAAVRSDMFLSLPRRSFAHSSSQSPNLVPQRLAPNGEPLWRAVSISRRQQTSISNSSPHCLLPPSTSHNLLSSLGSAAHVAPPALTHHPSPPQS